MCVYSLSFRNFYNKSITFRMYCCRTKYFPAYMHFPQSNILRLLYIFILNEYTLRKKNSKNQKHAQEIKT